VFTAAVGPCLVEAAGWRRQHHRVVLEAGPPSRHWTPDHPAVRGGEGGGGRSIWAERPPPPPGPLGLGRETSSAARVALAGPADASGGVATRVDLPWRRGGVAAHVVE
jgi:hypothetical protein